MLARKWTKGQDDALLAMYRSGMPIDEISRSIEIKRSALYRRLKELEEPARQPQKKRQPSGYYVAIKVQETAHPLVRQLLEEARKQRVNCKDLAALSRITPECINSWNRGNGIKLENLESVGKILGKKLKWIRS